MNELEKLSCLRDAEELVKSAIEKMKELIAVGADYRCHFVDKNLQNALYEINRIKQTMPVDAEEHAAAVADAHADDEAFKEDEGVENVPQENPDAVGDVDCDATSEECEQCKKPCSDAAEFAPVNGENDYNVTG